jgi:hypothetical protein
MAATAAEYVMIGQRRQSMHAECEEYHCEQEEDVSSIHTRRQTRCWSVSRASRREPVPLETKMISGDLDSMAVCTRSWGLHRDGSAAVDCPPVGCCVSTATLPPRHDRARGSTAGQVSAQSTRASSLLTHSRSGGEISGPPCSVMSSGVGRGPFRTSSVGWRVPTRTGIDHDHGVLVDVRSTPTLRKTSLTSGDGSW